MTSARSIAGLYLVCLLASCTHWATEARARDRARERHRREQATQASFTEMVQRDLGDANQPTTDCGASDRSYGSFLRQAEPDPVRACFVAAFAGCTRAQAHGQYHGIDAGPYFWAATIVPTASRPHGCEIRVYEDARLDHYGDRSISLWRCGAVTPGEGANDDERFQCAVAWKERHTLGRTVYPAAHRYVFEDIVVNDLRPLPPANWWRPARAIKAKAAAKAFDATVAADLAEQTEMVGDAPPRLARPEVDCGAVKATYEATSRGGPTIGRKARTCFEHAIATCTPARLRGAAEGSAWTAIISTDRYEQRCTLWVYRDLRRTGSDPPAISLTACAPAAFGTNLDHASCKPHWSIPYQICRADGTEPKQCMPLPWDLSWPAL